MVSPSDQQTGRWGSRPRLLYALAGVFLLNLSLRVFYLRFDFVNGDEAVRALTAVQLLDGARLYVDAITDKPPGATLFYASMISIFGRSMIAVHLAAILWNFLTALVVYLIGSRLFDKTTGILASFLFVYFGTNYLTQDTMAANTELLMALPYALSFWFFVKTRQNVRTGPDLYAAGLLTGVAALFKQVAIFNIRFFVICEAIHAYYKDGRQFSRGRRIAERLGRLAIIGAGVMTVIGILVVWLALTGALAGFWRNAVVLGAMYVGSLSHDLWLKFMITRTFGYVLFNIVIWSLAATPLVSAVRKRGEEGLIDGQGQLSMDLVIGLWGLCSLSGVFTSGRFYGHYFIQCLPALSLLAARGLRMMGGLRARSFKIAAATLTILFLFSFVRFHHRTAVLAFETVTGTRTRWSKAWGMTKREEEAEIIAAAMRERVGAGQPLFIWGYALDVYWRSECRPASRYLTPYYVTGHFYPEVTSTAEAPGEVFWQEARRQLIVDLRKTRPRLIINVDEAIESLPYTDVVEFINEHYAREGLLGPDPAHQFIVYKRRSEQD